MQHIEETHADLGFGTQITKSFKKVYFEKKETVEYLLKYGSPMERAKASLIKEVALQG